MYIYIYIYIYTHTHLLRGPAPAAEPPRAAHDVEAPLPALYVDPPPVCHADGLLIAIIVIIAYHSYS